MATSETMHEMDVIQPPAHPAESTIIKMQSEPEEAQRRDNADEEKQGPRKGLRLLAVMSALYVSIYLFALDQTVVSTAIPTIASDFKSAAGYTWVASAYLLAYTAAGPVWGSLSNIWGRKIVLLASVIWFAISSVICATSKSMGMLIAGRALQGVGGGGLVLLVIVCISDLFSMRERGFWYGFIEVAWVVASGTGPLIGGALAEKVSWRWIWWINLPCCGLAFLMLFLFLDVHNPRTGLVEGIKAIDWSGSLSILGLTLMLLLGLDFGGETYPWGSPRVICLIVFGVVMSVIFFVSETKVAKHPLMHMSILKHRSNIGSLVVCFAHGMSFIAAEYYLPLYYQSSKGASPIHSGLLTLPIGLATSISGIICGLYIHRTGRYREPVWVGSVSMTLGLGLMVDLSPSSTLAKIIPFQVFVGIGSGLLFSPPMLAMQALVSQDERATATATFTFVRNLATALSIVVGGVVFQNSMELRASDLKDSGLPANYTQAFSGKTAAANVALIKAIENPTQQLITKQAFSWSLRNMWILYAAIAACGIVAGCFIGKQTLAHEHVETRTGIKKSDRDPE